jgi:hypothetical protein
MKLIRLLLLAPVLVLLNFTTLETSLTKAERKLAVDYLKQTREDLLKSVKGLSKEQLNFKASPESWSVAECVEHIALSENNIFNMIQGTLKEEANPAKKSEITLTDDGVFKAIADRSFKVQTQEALKPSGKFGSMEETVKEFVTRRDEHIKYAEATEDDLRNHFFTFPVAAFGTVDSYQLILFMAGHSKRHTLQIEEVKANAAFPKK